VGIYFGSILAIALPAILLRARFNLPFELVRKAYHLAITLSILPLMQAFDTWYMAVLAALLLIAIAYPALALVEGSSWYKRVATEREGGEFKRSLVIVQVSISFLIFVFWGLLGPAWRYVAVVAVLAWGFGDAAAALVGKAFGRRRIRGKKTAEGTLAMYGVAGVTLFVTMLVYGSQPWDVSLVVALLVAPVCAVVELFSVRGMDTLTVPLSTAWAVLHLMALLARLGG
jgi:dolichol kinase